LPAGPFHRRARTTDWRRSRSILEVIVFVVAVGVVSAVWWSAWEVLGGPVSATDEVSLAEDIGAFVDIGLGLPIVLLTVRWVGRRPLGSVLSVVNRLRWRWLFMCVVLAMAAGLLSVGMSVVVFDWRWSAAVSDVGGGGWIGWDEFLLPLVMLVLFVPVQSAAEEVIARGWLLQLVGAYGVERPNGGPVARAWARLMCSPWPAILVSSVVFAAWHESSERMVALLVWALGLAWLTVRTGGLEAAIALHVVSNLAVSLPPVAFGMTNFGGGNEVWGWFDLDIFFYVPAVYLLARKRRITRLAAPEAHSDRR
jgi:CAAX protease family protein